jgi:predicted nucleic acid-binding protein
MVEYCLDTSIIIELLKNNKSVKEKLKKLVNADFFITYISICELYKGAYSLSSRLEHELNINV